MNGHFRRSLAATAVLMLAAVLTGCKSHDTAPGMAFSTPEAAVDSLVTALRTDDQPQLKKIFGSDSDDLLSSGDDVTDANAKAEFLERFDAQHRLVPVEGLGNDVMNLEIGPNQWPLPIPIIRESDGWRFDTAAGLDEMLNRRIGRNELATIETCRALADAQHEYYALNPMNAPQRQYADRFFSTPGSRDGLFWTVAAGEPPSPVGEFVVDAAEEGYKREASDARNIQLRPYHGYYFRQLKAQGKHAPGGGKMSYLNGDRLTKGFAIVAYPAEYGNSGIKTFMINHLGVVYQRDLGDDTAAKAKAMTEFDPSPEWDVIDETVTIEVDG
jgi:hypothetical protein